MEGGNIDEFVMYCKLEILKTNTTVDEGDGQVAKSVIL